MAWKIVMESGGGTVRDFAGGFETEKEAEDFAEYYDWKFADENAFVWSLSVEEEVLSLDEKIRQAEDFATRSDDYMPLELGDLVLGDETVSDEEFNRVADKVVPSPHGNMDDDGEARARDLDGRNNRNAYIPDDDFGR